MTTPMDIDQTTLLPFDSYPIEIFDRISNYLTIKQSGICRTVCRSWYKLFTPSQYRHIQIRGRRQFNSIYHSLESGNMGHYVRRLSVEDVEIASQELESLPHLCPNLVAFSFNGKSNHANSVPPFAAWKHLRRLTELQDLTVTHYLLSAPSTLSSLTHLSVRFDTEQHQRHFLASLCKATTELVSLSLDSVKLCLSDMETIHQSCPYLRKLRLINATLAPIATNVDEKRAAAVCLTPARFMKTFEYENGSDLYDAYEWLYYIGRKYPLLENLELWCAYSVHNAVEHPILSETDLDERYGALASIGMNCRQLKSLSLLNVTMNHWIFEMMDRVGTTLEHLGISDMTENTIDLLHYLSESQQNVSSLTLWGWSSLCIQETMEETIAMLGRCSDRLTSLTFSMQFSGIMNAPVPLDLLLTLCPHLLSLTLDSTQPSLPASMDNAEKCAKLTRFVLHHGSFRNDLFEYVALCCPRLTQLELTACALIAPGFSNFRAEIHMPHHHFERISINHIRPPSSYHHAKKASDMRFFDVSVVKEQKRGVYELTEYEPYSPSLTFNYEQKDPETSRPTKYVYHPDMNGQVPHSLVSIKCFSVNELNIGGFWVR